MSAVAVRVQRFGTGAVDVELPPGATVADAIRAAGHEPRAIESGRLSARARGSLADLRLDAPVSPGEEILVVHEVVGG